MARIARLLYDNLLIQAGVVVTASSEDFGYPATNMADPARWKFWRSDASITDQWVKWSLGGTKAIHAILLADYVAHVGGSIRVQANATDVWTAPTVDVALTLPNPNYTRTAGAWLVSTYNLSWVRVLFKNTAAVAQKVSVGAVSAGEYLQPSYGLAPRYSIGRTLGSDVQRVPGGQRFAERKADFFTISGGFLKQPDTDMQNFMAVNAVVGNHTPHFFAINPDDHGYLAYYGRFDRGPDYNHVVLGRWDMPFAWSEDV